MKYKIALEKGRSIVYLVETEDDYKTTNSVEGATEFGVVKINFFLKWIENTGFAAYTIKLIPQ